MPISCFKSLSCKNIIADERKLLNQLNCELVDTLILSESLHNDMIFQLPRGCLQLNPWLLPKMKHDKAQLVTLPTSSLPGLVLSQMPTAPPFCLLLNPIILGDLQASLSFNHYG